MSPIDEGMPSGKQAAEQPTNPTKRDKKRELLFQAALRLIGERGYAGASVEEIAARAGVAKGVVYYYFDSKAALAEQLIDTGLRLLASKLEEAIGDEMSPEEAIGALAYQQLRLVNRERDFAKFLLSEMWHDDRQWRDTLDKRIQDIVDIYLRVIKRGQDMGSFRTDMNTQFVASTLSSSILAGGLNWTVVHPELDLTELADEFTEYALAVLRAPTGA